MTRVLLIPVVVLALLCGAVVWSGGGGVREPADFTFINRGEIGTLDPNRMSWMQDIRVGYALWEGLYALDPATIEPVPGAAERVDVSPDKTVYTFHLRRSGWSNGDPVRSGDFVFAWRRMLEEPGDYTYLLAKYIKGAQHYQDEFAAKRPVDFKTVGIEAPDERTLRVALVHPVTFFPDLCAFPPFFPLNERSMEPFVDKTVREQTGRKVYDKKFTRPPHLATNGPYRLASWEFKRRVRLERNDHYWDKASVKSRVLEIVSAEDPQWAFLKFDSGAVDWIAEVGPEIAAELLAKKRNELKVFPAFGTYFYSVNCQDKLPDGRDNPLKDVRVRRALSMAIDKRPIVESITRLGEQPATTYIPLGVFKGYQSPAGLPFDVAGAKKLMAEAGYPDGRGFPRMSLLFNNEAHHGPVAEIVSRQWRENLGLRFELEGIEIKTFRDRLRGKRYEVARASWYGDYNDPSTFTDKYLSGSENNDAGWKNAEFDRLCALAGPEPDPMKRLALFAKAETIMLDEAPIIPLYYYVNNYLMHDGVRGLSLNPRNMVVFKNVEVVR